MATEQYFVGYLGGRKGQEMVIYLKVEIGSCVFYFVVLRIFLPLRTIAPDALQNQRII